MRIERGKLLRGAPYLIYGLLFVAGVIAALVGDKGYLDLRRLRAERTRAVAELKLDRERVLTSRRAVDQLRGNGLARERIAREKLGLVEPGEILILLSDDPRAKTAPRFPIVPAPSAPKAAEPPVRPTPVPRARTRRR